jgi:short-subunit dehydrogenase
MKRDLNGAVVVITGASSGIGREAALRFAEEGSNLVLAARDAVALEEVARLCQDKGAEAIAVPTDVSDEGRVEALREAAIARFGTIDVWVNDAAAYMLGPVEDVPAAAVRRLFDVNFMGVVHGTKAALRAMKHRDRGVIINMGSVAGKAAYAQASAYCASKHAVHGFTEALRQELLGTGIEACIVAPATVDTPLFEHSANYTGREIEAMKPIYDAGRVAAAIVACARRPRREVLVGAAPRMMSMMQAVTPRLFERVQPRMVEADHLGGQARARSSGNLFSAREPHQIDGGWKMRKPTDRRPMLGLAALVSLIGLGSYALAVRAAA